MHQAHIFISLEFWLILSKNSQHHKQTLSISHSSKTLLFIHSQSVPHFPLSFLYSQQVSKWAFKILLSHQSQPSLDCLRPFSLFKSNSFFFFCSGFCHTLKWNSHGFTCVPHPDPPSHLPLHPIPLGLPSAPGPNACLMHPTWAGDLIHFYSLPTKASLAPVVHSGLLLL